MASRFPMLRFLASRDLGVKGDIGLNAWIKPSGRMDYNKPTLIDGVKRFVLRTLCLSLPRRSVSAKAGALCG
jgi:hypothetical protein